MSKEVDKFGDRLAKAWPRARPGVPLTPQALADVAAAGGKEINRQTAATWIAGSVPKADLLFRLADALRVDSRWLATGEGEMVARHVSSELEPAVADLVARYNDADPRWQLSLRLLSYVATEDQFEVAGDVNVILARAFGKRPADIKYVSSKRVRQAYGDAPHVAAKHEALRVMERTPGYKLSTTERNKRHAKKSG